MTARNSSPPPALTNDMHLSVSGSHIDIGDNLRAHAATVLNATVDRHFGGAIEGKVMLARARHLFRADISVHVARGMVVQSHGEAGGAGPRGCSGDT